MNYNENYQKKLLEQNISIIKSADKFQEELSGEEISSFYKDYVHKMFTKMVKESYVVNVKM